MALLDFIYRQPGVLNGSQQTIYDPLMGGYRPPANPTTQRAMPPGSSQPMDFGQGIVDFFRNNPAMISTLASSLGSAPSFGQGFAQAAGTMPQALAFDKGIVDRAASRKAMTAYLKANKTLTPEARAFFENNPDTSAASDYITQSLVPKPKTYGYMDVNGQVVRTDPTGATDPAAVFGAPTSEADAKPTLTDIADPSGSGKTVKAWVYADGRPPVIAGDAPANPQGANIDFDNKSKLRAEYIKGSNDFVAVRDAYGRLQASANDNTGASDVAMVYSFMKMLDPGSAVREGEYATAEQTGGIPQQIVSLYNKMLTGSRLSPEMRENFVQQGQRQFEAATMRQNAYGDVYKNLAKSYGYDPSEITIDLTGGVKLPPPLEPGANQNAAAPAINVGDEAVNPTTGEHIRWDGTQWVPVK